MADHERTLRLLKTARGQIDGIIKMVEDDRYCVDISTQLMATQSLIRRINADVLKAHIEGACAARRHAEPRRSRPRNSPKSRGLSKSSRNRILSGTSGLLSGTVTAMDTPTTHRRTEERSTAKAARNQAHT